MQIRNLGHALTILARAEAAEHFMHADVAIMGAPGECHALVARGEARRRRIARKHAEAVACAPLRVIKRVSARRGKLVIGGDRWHGFVSRIYNNRYPF